MLLLFGINSVYGGRGEWEYRKPRKNEGGVGRTSFPSTVVQQQKTSGNMKFSGDRVIRQAPLHSYALSVARKESRSSRATEKAAEHAGWDSSAKVKGKVFCKQRAESRLSELPDEQNSQPGLRRSATRKWRLCERGPTTLGHPWEKKSQVTLAENTSTVDGVSEESLLPRHQWK